MDFRTFVSTATAGLLALSLVAAHPEGSGDPGAADNRGKALELTTEAAAAADDGFGALEDGSGSVKLFVDLRNERVCMNGSFDLADGQQVNLLHIHEKDADSANPQTGPVVASWDPYIEFRGGGITSLNWCIDDSISEDLELRDLLDEAADYYINAHVLQFDDEGNLTGAPVIRAELDKDLEV